MSYFDEPESKEPIYGTCPDCLDSNSQTCETCEGFGVVEVTDEELADDAADKKYEQDNDK